MLRVLPFAPLASMADAIPRRRRSDTDPLFVTLVDDIAFLARHRPIAFQALVELARDLAADVPAPAGP